MTIYRILAMVLRSAVHDRLLAASPSYKIKLPALPLRRLQALTAEQVGDFEHALERGDAVLALGSAPACGREKSSGSRAATLARTRPIVGAALPNRDIGLIFWSMITLPLSDVKARLSQIADEVHRTHERVTITKNGRSYLVLMAAEDLESMEATLELLSDPDAIARVQQARQDLAAGRGTNAEQMAELMAVRRERGGD